MAFGPVWIRQKMLKLCVYTVLWKQFLVKRNPKTFLIPSNHFDRRCVCVSLEPEHRKTVESKVLIQSQTAFFLARLFGQLNNFKRKISFSQQTPLRRTGFPIASFEKKSLIAIRVSHNGTRCDRLVSIGLICAILQATLSTKKYGRNLFYLLQIF